MIFGSYLVIPFALASFLAGMILGATIVENSYDIKRNNISDSTVIVE